MVKIERKGLLERKRERELFYEGVMERTGGGGEEEEGWGGGGGEEEGRGGARGSAAGARGIARDRARAAARPWRACSSAASSPLKMQFVIASS